MTENVIFSGELPEMKRLHRNTFLHHRWNREFLKRVMPLLLWDGSPQTMVFRKNRLNHYHYHVIAMTLSISELGDIPYNFKVYNYVPQFEVLKQSDLLITHGSMNSSNEALYNDIPLLIIPQLGDQTLIAKRIEELGAAIVLSNDVNESTIKNSVEILLSHSLYKESAKNIGQSLREAGGCKEATNFINQLL